MIENMTKFGLVRESVLKQSKNFHDEVIPLSAISFENLDSVRIGNDQFRMRTLAGQSMATRLGVPYQYLNRCGDSLQARNLNYWIEQQKADASDLFVRFDGNEVRGTFSKRYVPIDNLQIVDELITLGIKDEAEVQWYMDDQFMMLNIPSPAKKFALKKKDEMIPGVSISNSEVGLASFSVAAYLLRLICTNGLISKQHMTKSSYRHVSQKVLQNLPTILESATSNLELLTHSLKEATKVKVEEPEEKLLELNEQYLLNDNQREAVVWAWPQEKGNGSNSMWNILNAYTRAVQNPSLNTQEKYQLQAIAGRIASNF